jgi:hypothetical protein
MLNVRWGGWSLDEAAPPTVRDQEGVSLREKLKVTTARSESTARGWNRLMKKRSIKRFEEAFDETRDGWKPKHDRAR